MRNRCWTVAGLLVLMTLSAFAQAPQEAATDPWAKLQFLVGSWSGSGSGKPGDALAGGTTFTFELQKNILVRKNWAEVAPKAGEKSGAVHEDMMVIYREPSDGKLRAIYFDNEGHTIRYGVSIPGQANRAVFETDPAEKGPRFRLTYELGADGSLMVDFAIAPPGGEFRSYTKGTLKRGM